MFESINPATGERLRTYELNANSDIEESLALVWSTWNEWRWTSIEERAEFLLRLATLLDERATEYASLISLEMGKPLAEAVAEIGKCAATCRHYAEKGGDYLAPDVVKTEVHLSDVAFEPLGPILAVMPWNFPFWQVMRFFAPSVMAGNTAIIKHAENVQGCAEAIERVVADAAGRPGLLRNVVVARSTVPAIIHDKRIRAVTLTGSVAAGQSVAASAGQVGKKAVLELGGSDAFIVLADADLDRAVAVALVSRFGNSGQSCIAAKRFIVEQEIAEEFTTRLKDAVERLVMGNPLDPATTIGPMARSDLRNSFSAQISSAISGGARAVVGGAVAEGSGFFYPPTILTNVMPSDAVAREELFGPAAVILPFKSTEEAVSIANGTDYGLGAAIWTRDRAAAKEMIPLIEAGAVFVNDQVRSDPRVPFGGIKNSGYGRELGCQGIREFTNAKLRWIA
jgi:acyl-CoA reductase-like NAD-dependent aldehyde dehydrogenase